MRQLHALPCAVLLAVAAAATEPGIAPASGTAGTPVVITGHGFAPVRTPRVEFLPLPAPEEGPRRGHRAKVLSFDGSGITVETPRAAPGPYDLRVTPRGGEGPGPVVLPDTFTCIPPEVHSLDQESYLAGELCVLTGVFGSKKGGRVYVGPKRVRVSAWTPTSIQFVVPTLEPGEYPVQVRNRTGPGPSTHWIVLDDGEGPAPVPAVTLSATLLQVQVPQNCHRYFQITNTGEPGSQLSYTVADNGSLGGFLEIENGTGTLSQGMSANVGVRVLPEFADGEEAPAGFDLVLNVLTPDASNYVSIPVSVKVRSAAAVAQGAVGTWTGTWSGNTFGPNNPMQAKPTSAVSGTWSLALTAVDLGAETATGSLTWNGSDAYWTYTYGAEGYANVAPAPFVPDRTITFSGAKARLWIPGPQCGRFRLEIRGTQGASNPSDAFYGPDVTMDLDLPTGTVHNPGSSFTTHPYNPSNNETWTSTGTVSGSRQ